LLQNPAIHPLSLTRGRHSFKFGADYLHTNYSGNFGQNVRGTVLSFSSGVSALNLASIFPVWNDPKTWNIAALLAPAVVLAAGFGLVHGVVHDAAHRPISGADVQLLAAHSSWSSSGRSDAAGTFGFPDVPVGDYLLRVTADGFASVEVELTVVSGV